MGGGGGGMEVGEEGDSLSLSLYIYIYIYISLHCHHQNDSCIKMGSDESHFNVSLINCVRTKSQDSVHRPQLSVSEEKGEPKGRMR